MFFAEGKCTKGSACKFSHEVTTLPSAETEVPLITEDMFREFCRLTFPEMSKEELEKHMQPVIDEIRFRALEEECEPDDADDYDDALKEFEEYLDVAEQTQVPCDGAGRY